MRRSSVTDGGKALRVFFLQILVQFRHKTVDLIRRNAHGQANTPPFLFVQLAEEHGPDSLFACLELVPLEFPADDVEVQEVRSSRANDYAVLGAGEAFAKDADQLVSQCIA